MTYRVEREQGGDGRRGPRSYGPRRGGSRRRGDAAASGVGGVLRLQRQAGNAAVARWLGRCRVAQRFVGHEHESLGNVTGDTVDLGNGVVLTWGQVVAIAGDEFGSVEDLRRAAGDDAGRRRIRAALEHDGVRGPIPAALGTPSPEERADQERGDIMLLLENVTHFSEGGDARATWQSHHARALHKAFEAGTTHNDAAFGEAKLLEAFGQHYLTDMFSGGHVRTPRREIMEYYGDKADAMAAAFEQNLRTRLEDALVSQIMLQLPPQLRGNYTQQAARQDVHARIDGKIEQGMAPIGGRAQLPKFFGLALAGAVSGAMHDREGRQGVVVRSQAHPTPWLAKGDAMLGESPDSKDQAELAILAARDELNAARYAGEQEPIRERLVPADPPRVIHFAFDSSGLDGPAADAAAAAGAWLHANPGDVVELVGHTDPLGTDAYNMALGLRRANAVRAAIVAAGARPDQVVSATSQGEGALRTSDPKQYAENRRVELAWQCGASTPPTGPDPGADPTPAQRKAQQALAQLGPPYAAVEQYIPEAVPEMNEPLPEWRWGSMDAEMVGELDGWLNRYVGPYTGQLLEKVPETYEVKVDRNGVKATLMVTPRQFVADVVGEFTRGPSRLLGRLIGRQPGRA